MSLEEKWINNQISHESYNRWFGELRNQRNALQAKIDALDYEDDKLLNMIDQELPKLEDIKYLYDLTEILEKRMMVNVWFDYGLHYADGSYRTLKLVDFLSHNRLIMIEKDVLRFKEKRRGFCKNPPQVELAGI